VFLSVCGRFDILRPPISGAFVFILWNTLPQSKLHTQVFATLNLVRKHITVRQMSGRTIEIKTKDGLAPCQFFGPERDEKCPAVIIYMDAFGVRPALCDMAERLASNGYHVLLPDLYYRSGPTKPFDAKTAFSGGPEKDRLMALYQSINTKFVMEDTRSFLEFLEQQPSIAGPDVGCVGYCMGGAFALSAAGTFPARIAVAASLHGARLATDQSDSPHLLAPKMRGEIYVGIAGIDSHFTPEEKDRLESALRSAGVKYAVEVYPDVKHGFAVNDTAVYDRPASERHWERILQLFAENLPA
jgi:carboxymethylenebutenolidase